MAEDPALMRQMERLGLDVFRGDRDSLKEACQQYGLDLTAEVAELSSQPLADQPPAEWLAMQTTELVDHPEATHHQDFQQELPRFEELAAMVGLADGASHPELGDASTTVAQLRDNLEGSINKSIAVMTADQQAVKRLLDRLRELTHGDQTQADICTLTKALILRAAQLEANAHLHMQAESNHLFLAAGAL